MTTVTNERPATPELLALYDAVGWSAYTRDPDRLTAAVAGSHAVLTARDDDGRLVGLARTISDGASVCYLQDILVHPDAQRTGVGRTLLTAMLAEYADLRQFVLLTDDDRTQRAFYTSLGLLRSDESGLHAYLRP
ncbi:GNAT family N-acetyltransferase [Nakamurella lactea]|uniref:GNAT family N-acetyltransferase n=1 Tax=Nakamurella lactea TaxID=459515 RepID=UPI000427F099|nr:GNAT family N-acetyltransferase [Nakamurella lactea]